MQDAETAQQGITMKKTFPPVFGGQLLASSLVALSLVTSPALAGDWESSLEPEFTWYPNDNPNNEKPEADYHANSSLAITVGKSWSSRYHLFDLKLFAREDERDENRSHVDVREALLTLVLNSVEIQAGVGRVFWGVTEAQHVVDVINQDDFVENIDGEDKLGQPMLALKWYSPVGDFSGYALPYFRSREFNADNARPQLPLDVYEEDEQFEDAKGNRHVDYALRWKHYLGPVDIGLSWFKGTARAPRLQPCYRSGTSRANADGSSASTPNCDLNSGIPTAPPALAIVLNDTLALLGLAESSASQQSAIEQEILSEISLIPFYDQSEQIGIDLQYTVGPAAFKLEAVSRTQLGKDFVIADIGLEYTFSALWGTDADVSIVAEYLYDERAKDERFIATFDDDVFIGSRIGLNNTADTQMLGGVIVDQNHGSKVYSLEATQRLTDSSLLSLETRFVSDAGEDDPIKIAEHEDSIRLNISLFF